jgi:SAM-dependent methyltransferase
MSCADGGRGRGRYTSGAYLADHPTWHAEDSPWKAGQIIRMLRRHDLIPRRIVDVGCGAGVVLASLHAHFGPPTVLVGYDVSPHAIELAGGRATDRLAFEVRDIVEDTAPLGDLVLAIDVIEHLEDPFSFLRALRGRAEHAILHIPLDLTVRTLLSSRGLMGVRLGVGHLQHFTKDTALATLTECGLVVEDWFYTRTLDASPAATARSRIGRLHRELWFRCSPDFAVRVWDGWSLLVLAR